MASKELPSHHGPDGRFRNPWPGVQAIRSLAVLRWMWARARAGRLTLAPLGTPPERVPSAFINPRLVTNDVCVTWFGHSTFLLQFDGVNVLTDPMFSMRASPLSWLGPRRLQSGVIAVDALPPIDVILLSHDHYDHFDDASIRALARRFPAAAWCAPLGVAARLRARGVHGISECDWWDRAQPLPSVHLMCVPACHFSGRSPFDRNRTLWCGWSIAVGARRVCFVGDSALHPEFGRVGRESGPFDLVLMPNGAYEPRWLMKSVHMNPDEAIAAFDALAGAQSADARQPAMAAMVAMHWGTFVLTDEPVDEPPRRARAAWTARGLDDSRLWILAPGETRMLGQ